MHNIQSPRTDDDAIEQKINAKGLNAPRLSPDDLNANIAHTEIVKHVSPSGQVLRWAVLTTRNGFAVTGRPSASVSAENDDAEIGTQVAIANARQELWPLMGYQLKEQLFQAQKPAQLPVESSPSGLAPHQQRVVDEKFVLDDRREKLFAFMRGSKFHATCDEVEQIRLTDQYHAMTKYSEVLGERIDAFTPFNAPV